MSEEVKVREENVVEIPDFLTVRELAQLLDVSPIDVIKELMSAGVMANINQEIDYETAAIVAQEMGFEPVEESVAAAEEAAEEGPTPLWERFYASEPPENLEARPPVVTTLGHVDHGKTSLLDAIRQADVAGGEAGGITQHIGAYQIKHDEQLVTFIDTPGHEAFTEMRARGAHTTDIAILVVAADDGVMPQTIEAINHAQAARVPIVVALNKMDLPTAQPERTKQELADQGLVPDDWGGDTLCIPVSAKEKTGLGDLLDAILLVAEDSEQIKANPDRPAVGTVLEGRLDRTRGATATVLVQNGTLHIGDDVVAGLTCGRVRQMMDEDGNPVKEAGPSTPVLVLGLGEVPDAGEIFRVVSESCVARDIVAQREDELEAKAPGPIRTFTLDDFASRIKAGKVKELNLIIKTDAQGSINPIVNSLEQLGDEELKVDILHSATGSIGKSDVNLAIASKAIIIGFNVKPDPAARRLAESEGVDIRTYDIIYKLIDEVDQALKGLLEPTYVKVLVGEAQVRDTFHIPDGTVAGCYIRKGEARRNAMARVIRNGDQLYDGRVSSLKRFAEDVRTVRKGYECGVGLAGFDDFQLGDVIQFYEEREKQAE